MKYLEEQLKGQKARLTKIRAALGVSRKEKRLRELEAEANKVGFWEDRESARHVMQEIDDIKGILGTLDALERWISDVLSVVGEKGLESDVKKSLRRIEKGLAKLEIAIFLSGKYDRNDAILSIHAGQGGIEAMDWVQMLLRMYLRYVERQGWKVQIISETPGEEAGIKSVTLLVAGRYAYGYLKGEAGTHRLVRQSPFNADKLRQTSFALVEVLPRIAEQGEVEVGDDDLEWQFFRASSQGGQNVQKVSTAVRLTHKPTGITVSAQTQRYQEQNRKMALALLRAKLWERKMAERQEEERELKGEYRAASWGTQIRSYVLHPYHIVKDLRTGVEVGDTDSVLDGDLDQFIEAELRK